MQAKLTIANKFMAFMDAEATSQPQLKAFDWALSIKAATVNDPKMYAGSIPAGSSQIIFDGQRSTSIDGTTAFTSSLSTLDAGTRYRFTWTGGTSPGLRTDRGLTLSGQNLTVVLNADSTVNFQLGGGTFGTTAVGDTIYIPGAATGDGAPTPISATNTGFWVVLAVLGATNIQCARLPGESFTASGETVALTANTQFQAFSAAGVQVGDSVRISAGFAQASRRTYTVDRVTSTWFEVRSTVPIAAESGKLPGAAGMVFYTDAKRLVHVEVDQEALARFDADVGDSGTMSPVQPGDKTQPGWRTAMGSVYKLVVVNQSGVTLNFICLTAR